MVPFAAAPTGRKRKILGPKAFISIILPLLRFGTPFPRYHVLFTPSSLLSRLKLPSLPKQTIAAVSPHFFQPFSPPSSFSKHCTFPHALVFIFLFAGPSESPCFPPPPDPCWPFSGPPRPAHHLSPPKPSPPARTHPTPAPPPRPDAAPSGPSASPPPRARCDALAHEALPAGPGMCRAPRGHGDRLCSTTRQLPHYHLPVTSAPNALTHSPFRS